MVGKLPMLEKCVLPKKAREEFPRDLRAICSLILVRMTETKQSAGRMSRRESQPACRFGGQARAGIKPRRRIPRRRARAWGRNNGMLEFLGSMLRPIVAMKERRGPVCSSLCYSRVMLVVAWPQWAVQFGLPRSMDAFSFPLISRKK